MNRVGLVGTGPRSEVVSHLLQRAAVDVAHWTPDDVSPPDVSETVEAVEMSELADTPLVFVCLPMHRIRETIRKLGDVLTGRHAIVHTTRTLEPGSLAPISSIFGEETPTRRFGFLSGPMRPEDVLEDRGGSALCASPFPEVWEMVGDALDSPRFRVYHSDDLVGSEMAAAYARVIATAYGICTNMDLGGSILSTLFARGLDEMARFVADRGGGETTAYGLAGAGNLHADTTGAGHTDFKIGRRYVESDVSDLDSFRADLNVIEDELFVFLDNLADYAGRSERDYYILSAIERGLFEQRDLDDAFQTLMELPDLEE